MGSFGKGYLSLIDSILKSSHAKKSMNRTITTPSPTYINGLPGMNLVHREELRLRYEASKMPKIVQIKETSCIGCGAATQSKSRKDCRYCGREY